MNIGEFEHYETVTPVVIPEPTEAPVEAPVEAPQVEEVEECDSPA